MWKKFLSTFADVSQQPLIFPDGITLPVFLPRDIFSRKPELVCFNWLLSKAPCFPIKSNKVIIITEPKKFYSILSNKCQDAQKRIVLSSLYLGTGVLEQNLVSVIKKKLEKPNNYLRIDILLDFQRGSRGKFNSRSMLLPLLETSEESCRVSFYHSPFLRGVYKRFLPQRWNELIELQHMKVYLVDDTVIISGANLSNDYFTNRQDRYLMIEDKNLSDFYANLISTVQSFSFQLRKDGTVKMQENCPNPYTDDRNSFINHAQQKINQFYEKIMIDQRNNEQLYNDNCETWIMPLIQAGRLKIHLDSQVTSQIFRSVPPLTTLRIATGYFNLTKEYIQALTVDCKAFCSLLMAHPNANGFKGAKFPAGGIPDAYSLLAVKFYQYVKSFNQLGRFSLYEFEKAGWTFHGKGLWCYLPGDKFPSMTLIGSPNFGERSVNRDLETQIVLITVDEDLKKRLHSECETLHEYAKESSEELLHRKIPNWVKMTVRLFRNFF